MMQRRPAQRASLCSRRFTDSRLQTVRGSQWICKSLGQERLVTIEILKRDCLVKWIHLQRTIASTCSRPGGPSAPGFLHPNGASISSSKSSLWCYILWKLALEQRLPWSENGWPKKVYNEISIQTRSHRDMQRGRRKSCLGVYDLESFDRWWSLRRFGQTGILGCMAKTKWDWLDWCRYRRRNGQLGGTIYRRKLAFWKFQCLRLT